MTVLKFLSKTTREPLRTNDEGQYMYRQYAKDYLNSQWHGKGWIVQVKSDENIKPHLKIGDTYLPLERIGHSDAYEIPKSSTGRRKDDPFIKALLTARESGNNAVASEQKKNEYEGDRSESFAGLLYLYDKQGNTLEPPLYIEAGSLDEETEFKPIVARLKQLALLNCSPTLRPVMRKGRISQEDDKKTTSDDPDTNLMAVAQAFLNLCQSFEKTWSLIEKNPAQETKLSPTVIDLTRNTRYSSQVLQQMCKRPDLRRAEVLAPSYSLDTQENRFLVFVLNEIAWKGDALVEKLNSQSEQLKGCIRKAAPPLNHKGESLYTSIEKEGWELEVKRAKERGESMSLIGRQIKATMAVMLSYQQSPLLSCSSKKGAYPSHPSIRLMRSKEYSGIYHAYLKYRKKEKSFTFVPLKRGFERALNNGTLQPVHRLYELWVLVETYDMLISKFGFLPIHTEGQFHPLQCLDADEGAIDDFYLSGEEFHLQFQADNNPNFTIDATLKYEVETIHNYKPDLWIEIRVADGQPITFAVDAKYRRYHNQSILGQKTKDRVSDLFDLTVNIQFEYDLFVTSKKKYLEKLGSKASFIVHSDKEHEYTFWGGTKYPDNQQPDERFSSNNSVFPDHRFGAVCVTPNSLGELERLLKCFLMYHARIDNICWQCRRTVSAVDEIKIKYEYNKISGKREAKPTKVGTCYQCKKCYAWWVYTFCEKNAKSNGGDTILKIGHQTFHTRDPKFPKMYLCPKCGGNYLGKQRIGETYHPPAYN